MAEELTYDQTLLLKEASGQTLSEYASSLTPLSREELKELRTYDFRGILKAALLYLLLMLARFRPQCCRYLDAAEDGPEYCLQPAGRGLFSYPQSVLKFL